MLISFLYPFSLRGFDAPYLWIYYHQIQKLGGDNLAFILDESYKKPLEYFIQTNRNELNSEYVNQNINSTINNYKYYILPSKELQQIYSESDDLAFFKKYLTVVIPDLYSLIFDILQLALKDYKIDAVLSWSNCPSLQKACDDLSIKVIYNEIGPLRSPQFVSTGFFDFSGVNGCTSSERRFEDFLTEYREGAIKLYSTDAVLNKLALIEIKEEAELFDYGVALQVENDSNIVAYANEYNNVRLIDEIKNKANSTLIRKHPASNVDYTKFGVMDDSITSISFIKKCNKIASVNSGTIMEAILLGKSVEIYGDCPYKIINFGSRYKEFGSKEYHCLVVNFLALNYLIPFQLIFDIQYIGFRLSNPSESQIRACHLVSLGLSHNDQELFNKNEELIIQNQELVNRNKELESLGWLLIVKKIIICKPIEYLKKVISSVKIF